MAEVPGSMLTGVTFCCQIFFGFTGIKPVMAILQLLPILATLWKNSAEVIAITIASSVSNCSSRSIIIIIIIFIRISVYIFPGLQFFTCVFDATRFR